jgi:hypothetical protein
MKKILQIGNGIAFFAMVFINYLSNTGAINNTIIGGVSDTYKTLFTPAGYAFSIWGFIYLLLLGFIVYQGRSLFVNVRDDAFILKIGWWFIISCIANSLWVFCWLYGYTAMSCVCMFVLLFSLLRIVTNNNMEIWDAPISVIAFLWWPFVFYSGWITVASVANVSSLLVKNNWDGFGISPISWTIIMIIVATIINLYMVWTRNMREFALVGAWALAAIAYANYNENMTIVFAAITCVIILILNISVHGYKNRATNPFLKFKEYNAK